MKYLYLIWVALLRRKGRTVITLLTIVVGFLLFGLMDLVKSVFALPTQHVRGIDRLLVTSTMFFVEFIRRFAAIDLVVGSIMGAVFFALVRLTGNIMERALRDRIAELATLKAAGFTAGKVLGLVLGESVALLLGGGLLGLAFATLVEAVVHSTQGATLPMSQVTEAIWLRGLTLAEMIGFVVGAPPAVRAMRLRIVNALSETEWIK